MTGRQVFGVMLLGWPLLLALGGMIWVQGWQVLAVLGIAAAIIASLTAGIHLLTSH